MISKGKLLSKVGLGRMSVGEYQASLTGLNIFFGAVLGLVLTGAEKLNGWQFGAVLAAVASVVVSILYISSSRNRVIYSLYAIVSALALPWAVDLVLKGQGILPDKVRPTLLVWTILTIAVEFWARDREQDRF
jgi:hypothetical protein